MLEVLQTSSVTHDGVGFELAPIPPQLMIWDSHDLPKM